MEAWSVPVVFAESWITKGMSALTSLLLRISDNSELQGKVDMEMSWLLFRQPLEPMGSYLFGDLNRPTFWGHALYLITHFNYTLFCTHSRLS